MKLPISTVLLFPVLALAQSPTGSYMGTSWQINNHHTLIWGGQPYMPVGQKVEGAPSEITRATGAGTRDFLVDLPANGTGWGEAFAELNKSQSKFLLRINSLAPMANGIAVEPQGYRVPNITKPRHVEFALPDASSALVLLVSQRDASVTKSQRVPIINGMFSFDTPSFGMPHVLLVYPEMKSLEQPDFWEGFDEHRDAVLNSLKKNPPGAGLRGIVDPLGHVVSIPNHGSRFVPTSSYFRDELAALLTSRYRSLETATKAWSINAPSFDNIAELSRTVPLWSGYRGVPQLWDPATDRVYLVDNRRSAAWKDINDAIFLAATRRFRALVSAIRSVTDVPVVQGWAGWAPPYDGSQIAIDGVGLRAVGGSPNEQIDSSCRAVSSVLRWNRPGWLIATEVELGDQPNMNLDQALHQLSDMGVRACFVKATPTTKTLDTSLSDVSPVVLYFPQNATNPPMAQRLPGGMWWLPSPADGDRIDLGSKFSAYRLNDGNNSFTAIWSPSGPQRATLRFTDIKSPTFETIDGSNPNAKQVKNGIEMTVSDLPLIIRNTQEIPVPDQSADETAGQFMSLLRALGYDRGAVNEEEYRFAMAARGFARSPGDSLMAMRQVLRSSLFKVAPYVWIEAEGSSDHNFSQIEIDAGCSMGRSLAIDSKISPEGEFSAAYKIPVRNQGEQELWIAARIPEAFREDVSVTLAGSQFKIPQQAVSAYGDGFKWYRLGTTRLGGRETSLRISVVSPHGADLEVDTILLHPGTFRPNGVQMPLVPEVKMDAKTQSQFRPSVSP